jgi:hypothetical protein
LDALNEGGRLLFPLIGSRGGGVSLLLTNPRVQPGTISLSERGSVSAKVIGYCGFVPCHDAFDPAEAANVTAASPRLSEVRSLIRNDKPDDKALLVGEGWWLSK